MRKRRVVIVELILIELVVVLVLQLALGLLPDRRHAVEGLGDDLLFVLVLAAFLELLMLNIHLDGVADIVGILLYYHTELVVLKILVILLFCGIFLYLYCHHSD